MVSSGLSPLRILLQFMRAQESGDAHAFRFEPQDYILPTSGGESPSARFEWTQDVLADLCALRLPGRDPALVKRVGDWLRSFVEDAGWEDHAKEIAQALAEKRAIFVTIRSSAAELYTLPWELLTLKSSQYMGQKDGLLLRYEWPGGQSEQEHPRPRPEGGRILVAWSAAGGAVPAAEHIQAIRSACAAGFHPFDSDADVLAHASLGRIAEKLEAAEQTGLPIAVLHLLCHGGTIGSTFGLCLDGESGAVVVDAGQVADQLAPFARMVRLVVLAACDSGNTGVFGNQLGSVAQALHRCGFRAVIASRFPLSVAGSVELTRSFYGELLSGPASLEASFLVARKRLSRGETDLPGEQRQLDWASVQLYVRHEDGDDTRPLIFRPFRGLLAFQPEHRRFFFGRDQEIQEILNDLQALIAHKKERFLVVAGASGTGKSSMVLAGAVPRLLEQNPQLGFLRMRPGSDPNRALEEVLAYRPADGPVLLVVDQFEEVFTQTESPTAREAFARRLFALASAPEPGLRVLLTLRIDFLGRCGELLLNDAGLRLDRVAFQEESRVFIAQLPPAQLCATIVEPARKVGLELQAGLADRMLQEVGSEPGALPLLEDTLDVLWQYREGRMLTQDAYARVGGVIGALRQRADAVVDSLPPVDLPIAQRLFVSLVAVADDTTQDTRRRVSLTNLQRDCAFADAAGVERVLKKLVTARLLVQGDENQISTVEVAHEALIRKWPRLRRWLDEDRAGLLTQRRIKQAAQHWEDQHCDESLLYRGTQLAQASEWRKTWDARMGEQERRFLEKSEAQRAEQAQEEADRQRKEREAEAQKLAAAQTLARRTRIAAVVLSMLLLGAVGTGILAYQQWQIARERFFSTGIERGQELLFEEKFDEALLWLHRAKAEGSKNPALPDFLKDATLRLDQAKAVLIGHDSPFVCNMFSPDGQRIVTASKDGTARVWKAETGQLLFELKGHRERLRSAMFSPNGRRIVTASEDTTARVWEAETGRFLFELKGHRKPLQSAMFSPDGRGIVTASEDTTARVWEAETGRLLFELKDTWWGDEIEPPVPKRDNDGESPVFSFKSVVISPDGHRIVSLHHDDRARVWDAATGRLLVKTRVGHELMPQSAIFSLDGHRIVIVSKPRTFFDEHSESLGNVVGGGDGNRRPPPDMVQVRETETGRLLFVIEGHSADVTSAAYSPDGRRIVTTSEDKTARVWEAETGRLLAEFKGHSEGVTGAAFSPDARRIVTASKDRSARVWEAETGRLLAKFKGHSEGVTGAAFSPDARRIVTVSEDRTARLWEPTAGRFVADLKGHEDGVNSAAYSPDGHLIATASSDKKARVWEAETQQLLFELEGHEDSVNSAIFSPDGHRIVTTSRDKTARVWEVETGHLVTKLQDLGGSVNSAMFSPNGHHVVTASNGTEVRIWEAETGRLVAKIHDCEGSVNSAMFSPNGHHVVTVNGHNVAQIWEVETGRLVANIEPPSPVRSVKVAMFNPDGRRILIADSNTVAEYADRGLGWHPTRVLLFQRDIMSVAYSPDGRRILIVNEDQDIPAQVWEIDSNRLVVEIRGHGDGIERAAFSPDGRLIATISQNKKARIWEANGGKLVAELKGHGGQVWNAAFRPDSHRIVTASQDKTARIWDLSPETRTTEQLARLISCHITAEFENEGSVIIYRDSSPEECAERGPWSPARQLRQQLKGPQRETLIGMVVLLTIALSGLLILGFARVVLSMYRWHARRKIIAPPLASTPPPPRPAEE